jgi:PAS domain S-box-containing protein
MTGQYSDSADIWLPLFTIFFLIGLSVYSWLRRGVPGALPLALASLFTALWAAGSMVEYLALDRTMKIMGVKFQAIWQLPAAAAITCFILEYSLPGRWLSRRFLALLGIVSLLNVAMIVTNDLHHLAWRGFKLAGEVVPEYGPGGWLFLAYIYGLGVVNLIVFAWLFFKVPQQRWPVMVMASGQIAVATIFLLEVAQIIHPLLRLEMVAIATYFLLFGNVLYGFYIFDPVPLGQRLALEQMQMGMLVLDYRRRVVSLNRFAEQLLQVSRGRAIGRLVGELLPDYREEGVIDAGGMEVELSRESVGGQRHYTLTISLLKDWRGLDSGCLLLVRDVTEQKQAQAQVLAQQHILATLQERERLARDLHDTLGQVLGYASLQVEAASKLARDGAVETATRQLDRLAGVIREAHADVREHILNLRTAPSLQRPFLTAIEHYLDSFSSNYDIQTQLEIGRSWNGKTFSAEAQLQIFRIVQEALSNARRHGKARRVQVKFEIEEERPRMVIEDNGLGFCPEEVERVEGRHFGLQFMQERASQLGGHLQIDSRPGKGTRVVLDLPGKER